MIAVASTASNLSPQQRRALALAASRPNLRARAVFRVPAGVTSDAASSAVARLVRRHPELRLTVDPQDEGALVSGDLRLSVEPAPRSSDRLVGGPPSPEDGVASGASGTIYWLASGENHRSIAFDLPPFACDAAGLKRLVEELVEDLTGRDGLGRGPSYEELGAALSEMLDDPDAADGLGFWSGVDLQAISTARVPFVSDEPSVAFAPRTMMLALPEGLLSRLWRGAGLDPVDALLGCWAAFLGRMTDSKEIHFGLVASGRTLEGLETVVGPLARALPLVVSVDPATSASALARALGDRREAMEEHQEFFVWLPEPGETAEFQLLFDVVDRRLEVSGDGGAPSLVELRATIEPFALQLTAARLEKGWSIELSWDAAKIAMRDARRLAGCFETFLRSVAERPDSPLAEHSLLLPAERHRLVIEYNDTAASFDGEERIEERVRAAERRFPDRIAIVADGAHLSFAELAHRAGCVAGALRARDVSPDERVGLGIERSIELVVALLGILEAGASYLPLDLRYPAVRRAELLSDAGARLAIRSRRDPRLPGIDGVEEVEIESLLSEATPEPETTPGPDGLAYVIYTSGSTGRPKGVAVSHAAILNRLLWMQREYPLHAFDRVLQKTAVTFDASIWEIFCPLISGATVVMAEPEGHRDPAYLAKAIQELDVTVLQLVPSVLGPFLDALQSPATLSLRRLYCGGEALSADLAERVRGLPTRVELVNLYGPTEVSIDASSQRVDGPLETAIVPIGRAIARAQLYVLGRGFDLMPAGAIGELAVGGAGLARGYLGRPDLTAGRFVPSPFGVGSRLYLTGDLARLRADGRFEYLGRSDQQVKVRGVRIEPGEIETALRRTGVSDAVVVVRADAEGIDRLVAYYVPGERELDPAALRTALAGTLPEPMVPSAFMALGELPRLANGKIDRAGLPAIVQTARATQASSFVSPIEEIVAGIWRSVLGLEPIGRDDDFFELGGHSLLATQALSRLRTAFGIELPMRTLFEAPVVKDLARAIELEGAGARSAEPSIDRASRGGDLPLSFAQERLVFLDRLQPGSHAYNLGSALRFDGEVDLAALRFALDGLWRRHESLRTFFPRVRGEAVQRIAPPSTLPVSRFDLSALPIEKRDGTLLEVARRVTRGPFVLEAGPLFRAALVALGPGDLALLVSSHHAVTDAWSNGILMRELAELYTAHRAGRPPRLRELPIQYADFAVWQRAFLAGGSLEQQIAYWRGHLAGAPSALALPFDLPRAPVQSFRGATVSRSYDLELTSSLRRIAAREGSTLYMVLLGAFELLLWDLAGASDFVVGTSIANRNREGVEGLVGFFVNVLPLRAKVSGELTFRQLLGRVRNEALGGYANQDVPFGKLVEALRPGRDAARNPLFQVIFTYENAPTEGLEIGEVRIQPIALEVDTTILDLALVMWETSTGLSAVFRYCSDLLRPATTARWLDRFGRILALVAERPDTPVAEIKGEVGAAQRRERELREADLERAGIERLKIGRRSATAVRSGRRDS